MILNKKSQTNLSSFNVIYKGSVCNETTGIRGIAHLGEHLMCKGLEKYQNDFEKDGISWNAYTSNNEIVFYCTGLEQYLSKWRNVFIESLSSFEISKDDFEKEKRIVIQEYNGTVNSQEGSHYLNFDRKYLNHYQPIGSLKDLESMTYLDMMNFYEKQYMIPDMIINVSAKHTYKDRVQEFANSKIDVKYEIKKDGYDYEHIHYSGLEKSPNASIIIGSPLLEDGNEAYYSSIINQILSGGLNSPLYQEIREKRSLVYGLGISTSRIGNQGIIYFSASASDKNSDEIVEQFQAVLNGGEKTVTKERFDIVMNKIKISLEKEEINRFSNVSRYFTKDEYNLEGKIDKITYDKLMDYYNTYYIKNLNDWIISVDKKDFEGK